MLVACLLFLAEALCYLDRVAISVAVVHLRLEEGWSEERLGILLSAFYWGYILSQIPASLIAFRYGGHIVLCAALAGWSLQTLLLPVLVSSLFPLLLASRIALGVFEGAVFPSVYAMLTRWMPLDEKVRVTLLRCRVCARVCRCV